MLFSGFSALMLIFAVKHFDPPEAPRSERPKVDEKIAS
jgi:hypothetical protein